MCIRNTSSRELLSEMGIAGQIGAFIIDEVHCISQWGGDFRTAYSELDKLRTFVPHGTPIVGFSATVVRKALNDISRTLHIDLSISFFLNLGNDRPNIKYTVLPMKSGDDLAALDPLLDLEDTYFPSDLPKTIIFANTRDQAQRIWRYIRERLPEHLREDTVDYVHSLRTRHARERSLARFLDGSLRILVGTESVGMVCILFDHTALVANHSTSRLQGADIPDVERVIQFGAPSSLSVWLQRAGRAGRMPELRAEAILLIERSVFQKQKRRKRILKKGQRQAAQPAVEPASNDLGDMVYKKPIEKALRDWVETARCRRDVSDEYFDNPPRGQGMRHNIINHTQASQHPGSITETIFTYLGSPLACCDNCSARSGKFRGAPLSLHSSETDSGDQSDSTDSSRSSSSSSSSSPPSELDPCEYSTPRPETDILMPSSCPNTPQKRRRNCGDLEHTRSPKRARVAAMDVAETKPERRYGKHRESAAHALREWRLRINREHYAHCAFSLEAVLPEKVLRKLAFRADLKTVDDIAGELKGSERWIFLPRYGKTVLEILQKVDQERLSKQLEAGKKTRNTRGKLNAENCAPATISVCYNIYTVGHFTDDVTTSRPGMGVFARMMRQSYAQPHPVPVCATI